MECNSNTLIIKTEEISDEKRKIDKGGLIMANYQEMYRQLFTAQTAAIEILQQAQQQTEELYIDSPDPTVLMLDTTIAEISEKSYSEKTLHPPPKKRKIKNGSYL